MMVDDAHASGVFGANGRGTVDHFGMHGRVDVQVGTLSKAIGALGGYVAGTRAFIEFLHHRARPFLFSTSHPPSVTATCIAALDVLQDEPQIIDRLWENTRFFKAGLQALGFNTGVSESPITPVIVGDGALAMTLSDRLFAAGVFAQGICVPDRRSRQGPAVRTIVTATHTRDQLQFALDTFKRVGLELGIISLMTMRAICRAFIVGVLAAAGVLAGRARRSPQLRHSRHLCLPRRPHQQTARTTRRRCNFSCGNSVHRPHLGRRRVVELEGPLGDRDDARAFATAELQPGVTKAVVQERERQEVTLSSVPGRPTV